MKAYLEIDVSEGEIVAAGYSENPVAPRTWISLGKNGGEIQIIFHGMDAPLAEKIAQVIEDHRRLTGPA